MVGGENTFRRQQNKHTRLLRSMSCRPHHSHVDLGDTLRAQQPTHTQGYCAQGRVAHATLMMTLGGEGGEGGRDTFQDQQHAHEGYCDRTRVDHTTCMMTFGGWGKGDGVGETIRGQQHTRMLLCSRSCRPHHTHDCRRVGVGGRYHLGPTHTHTHNLTHEDLGTDPQRFPHFQIQISDCFSTPAIPQQTNMKSCAFLNVSSLHTGVRMASR